MFFRQISASEQYKYSPKRQNHVNTYRKQTTLDKSGRTIENTCFNKYNNTFRVENMVFCCKYTKMRLHLRLIVLGFNAVFNNCPVILLQPVHQLMCFLACSHQYSTQHFFKQLAAFLQRLLAHWLNTIDACHSQCCQTSERMQTELGFGLITPGLTARAATD